MYLARDARLLICLAPALCYSTPDRFFRFASTFVSHALVNIRYLSDISVSDWLPEAVYSDDPHTLTRLDSCFDAFCALQPISRTQACPACPAQPVVSVLLS